MTGNRPPRRGELYWAELDPTEGHEQAGRRPVLVLSSDRYNDRSGMVVVVPLTTRDKLLPPLAVSLGVVGGRAAFALPAQVRALSRARLGKKLEGEGNVDLCLDALLQICGRSSR